MIDELEKCLDINGKQSCSKSGHYDIFFNSQLDDKPIVKNPKRNLRLEQKCKLGGSACATRNLFTGFVFFSLFVFVGFAWVFMHELFHFMAFVSMGYPVESFSFGAISGSIIATIPTSAPSWWYFVAIGGPLLFVNTLTVVITILIIPVVDRRSAFFERNIVENRVALRTLATKAIGSFSAFILLSNTVLLPIMSLVMKSIATVLGTDPTYSDMELWWNAILFLPVATERLAQQLLYVFVFGFETGVAMTFFMVVRKGGSKNAF